MHHSSRTGSGRQATAFAVATVLGLGVLAAPALAVPAIAAPAGAATPQTPHRVHHGNVWATPANRDILSPATRTVLPHRVYRDTGTVSAPGAVLHGRTTTLAGAHSSITLDFGKEVGGLVTVGFADGDTGQQLGVAFSESSQYVGETSDASNGGSGSDGALTADVTPNGSWTQPTDKLRGGFRYLTLFDVSGGSIAIDKVSLHITFDPSAANLRDYANWFHSSDPLLNRIWYAGAYTVQTNTITPTSGRVWGPPASGWENDGTVGVGDAVLVDGAKRDRTVWPGDLGVSVPTEFASLGDLTPTRNALTTLYDHQADTGELPFAGPEVNFYGSDTYHLWTLIGTANYVQYSHDTDWLAGVWPDYVKALRFSLDKVGGDGLMTVTGTADWARSDQGGENIEANALLYRALRTGAQLARLQHDGSDATAWTTTATRLRRAVNDTLWDVSAGQYRDNPTSSLHPQDGNSLAVWYGLAPAARAARISASLTTNWNRYGATTPEKDGEIGTFPGSLELQAHLQAGDTTTALRLMRREWGYMLDSPLGTHSTFWEGYLADGRFGYGGAYMSAAHGWSTGPTSALTFYVLGIRPASVDGSVDVMPQTGALRSTAGSLRTALGDVTVSWRHLVARRQFVMTVDAARAAVGHVGVPTYGARTDVRVDGRLAWSHGRSVAYAAHRSGDYIVLTGLPAHAVVRAVAVGRVRPTLSASITATTAAPVLAGHSSTVDVTVRATGDTVRRGTVTITAPAGWTSAPVRFTADTRFGPVQRVIGVPVTASSDGPGGPTRLPVTVRSGRTVAHAAASLLAFGNWPAGTTATASSHHAANTYNGAVRTYDPGNAIDGDLSTFWNDDTAGVFPDTLTVTSPSAVRLRGVGVASLVDGVPTDYSVQTWDGSAWTTRAQVSGNAQLGGWVAFDRAVSTSAVRVVITASQTQNGNYSRVAELAP